MKNYNGKFGQNVINHTHALKEGKADYASIILGPDWCIEHDVLDQSFSLLTK